MRAVNSMSPTIYNVNSNRKFVTIFLNAFFSSVSCLLQLFIHIIIIKIESRVIGM